MRGRSRLYERAVLRSKDTGNISPGTLEQTRSWHAGVCRPDEERPDFWVLYSVFDYRINDRSGLDRTSSPNTKRLR